MHKEHLVIELPKGMVLEGTIKGADASGYVTVRATEDGLKIVTDSLELCRTAGPAVQFKPWDQSDAIKPRRFGPATAPRAESQTSAFQSSILDMLASEGDAPDAEVLDTAALAHTSVARIEHADSDADGQTFDEASADVQFADNAVAADDTATAEEEADLLSRPVPANFAPDEEVDEVEGEEYDEIPD